VPQNKIVPHRTFAKKTCYGMKLPDTWAASLLNPDDAILKIQLQLKILQLKLAIMKLMGLS
jgi:hypothetical protein